MNNISIIIPAHNESAVISRCLTSLVDAAAGSAMRVWVVANACSDDTAAKSAAFGEMVSVIDTEIPSKANALNLGDDAAVGFPRFYVDADVTLEPGALVELCKALEEPGVLAVAPRLEVDCSNRPWGVRAYYAVWLQTPYCRSGMIGSGIYGVSEEGRQRFDRFPQITADDAFVRLHFAAHERKTVESCSFTVTPPKTLGKIIDIKTRSHFGNAELKQQYPHLWKNEEARHGNTLLRLAINPLWWPALAVYAYVKFATRYRARKRFQRGEIHQWERDDSSREVASN
ncbi:glycosyltransferase [Blastopirellula marina]|uniref:Glycosyl transferase n=1 Tax=Blastopirellula marina TaxID=124 RepID=A0A2S8GHI6_9BACT|nr:glycosyltransferase family 2 protein [Blastopirellula marina]PQO43903.1 glycosyl transferase [Blastopirellula marina]